MAITVIRTGNDILNGAVTIAPRHDGVAIFSDLANPSGASHPYAQHIPSGAMEVIAQFVRVNSAYSVDPSGWST